MPATDIRTLIAELPELYQPVFQHPEYDAEASRPCLDRLRAIAPVVSALREQLGRRVRVLDLGCAQGFFALSLAAAGADVIGVDRLPQNLALCRALASEHQSLSVRFLEASAEDLVAAIIPDEYDVMLGLSFVHHLCHETGVQAAIDLFQSAAARVQIILVETALRSEPMYWAPAQPEDPRELFSDIAFVHVIAKHATHLSTIERPLFFASSHWWYLGGELVRFESWTRDQHELVGEIYQRSRRYYFASERIAKYYDFRGSLGDRNREELRREAEFLEAPPAGLRRVPALYAHAIVEDCGWLIREFFPGRRVSTLIDRQVDFDRLRVLWEVLDDLCALEAVGLYHADVRVWNVILGDDGQSSLIDYGDITANAADCAWPGNVFLSFLVFVYELQGSRLPRIAPTRVPRFSPEHFEEPYRSWIGAFWRDPPERWSFARLRELLHQVTSGAAGALGSDGGSPPATVGGSQWAAAIEQYLDVLGMEQHNVSQRNDVVSRLTTERLSIQSALETERAAHESAERMAAELRVELAARDSAIEEARLTGAALRASVAALTSQAERLLNDVAKSEIALAERDRTIEERRLANASLLDAASEHESRLGEEMRARESAEQRAKSLEREREQQSIEANHWWRATAQLTEELRIVYSTLSWRITAPLRWVKGLFRGAAQRDRQPTAGPWRPGLRGAVRYVGKRPRLRSWIGARLDRFPSVKRRLKSLAVEAAATPASVATQGQSGSQANGVEIGRTARDVHARLRAALDRRRNDGKDVAR